MSSRIQYPEGEIRYYGFYYPVEILPRSQYPVCERKFKSSTIENSYPCLILTDFTTQRMNVFKNGEKVLLPKRFLKKNRKELKNIS
jgi:hypothetical protein